MKNLLLISSLLIATNVSWAKDATSGTMPELKLDASDEDANQKKAVQSEVLIAKSEAKAIAALNAVLKKKKGSPVEADLWYRMAELYMRRAKSGRFFDLTRGDESGPVKFAPPEVRDEKASANLKQAVNIYAKIDREFPKFGEMDSVLFNAGFASQQLAQRKNAEAYYNKLVEKYPRSQWVPDAYLSLGEMAYDAGQFGLALERFKNIEKYPNSRVYSYGLYKQAWTNYNLHQAEAGIEKLIQVVKFFNQDAKNRPRVSHNLRQEALRDLALFFGESHPADQAYPFFAKICTSDELGEAMINLGKLYDSHSRQKEMNVFLGDFMKKHPDSPSRLKAELLLINGNETLKNRPLAIEHLETANGLCRPGAAWRTQHKSTADAECDYDLAKVTLDLAKKWWDLWLKNKHSKEMAALTEKAFKLRLETENPQQPDAKAHYAYAELLFQQGKFRESSEQYEFSSKHSKDTQIAHDAAYSSLVSMEKAAGKTITPEDSSRMQSLADTYLKKYPKGAHANQARYKLGFLAYDAKNFEQAEKVLRPIAVDPKEDPSIRTRAQDIVLDILNARQDLNGIRDFAKANLAQASTPERKKNLQKIMTEADYNSIQKSIDGTDDKATYANIKKLVAFSEENKDSTLAKNSLWQAMSLAFSNGLSMEGADLAIRYSRQYPNDDRVTAALRDAAKHYNEQGFLLKAAGVLEILAPRVKQDEKEKIFEAVSEIYALEGRKKDAREFMGKLLETADKKEQGKLYQRLLATYKGEEKSAEYQKLEGKIMNARIEPSYSEIRMRQIEALFASKKHTEAFNQAKNLVGGDGTADIRARARLIQAKVLEHELIEARTKTSLDKLPLVLSIKTDKLDKAQQAYLAAGKMSQNPNIQLASLEGLARIYRNYVENVGSPIIKTAMKDDEKKALHEELAKLVSPIKEKQLDTENKLKALAKSDKTATVKDIDFDTLPVGDTVKARIPEIAFDKIPFYLPRLTQEEGLFVERASLAAKPTCTVDEKDLQKGLGDLMVLANNCIALKRYAQIEKIALQMAQIQPKTGVAPFYLSLAASAFGQHEKALYLIDLAIKKSEQKSFFWYQKALALGLTGERASANQWMIKAYDERLDSWETKFFHGVVAYSQGDCFSVVDDFKSLPAGAQDRFGLTTALTECMAQKGEVDQALALVQKTWATQKSLDLALQWGHLIEVYKMDSKMAVGAYEKAKTVARSPESIEWINRKIKWLNNPNSVSDFNSSHVGSKVAKQEDLSGGQ